VDGGRDDSHNTLVLILAAENNSVIEEPNVEYMLSCIQRTKVSFAKKR
jgi:hypothetical protein